MKIRIAGIIQESIVDGPGIRFTVFVQGCPHRCLGCHNPHTHDFQGGEVVDTDDIIVALEKNCLIDGLTLSGGEPFCQPEACAELARAAQALGLSVWSYTGWTYEQILERANDNELNLLEFIDVLVDGRFEQDLKTLELPWRGSANQRIIELN